MNDVARIFQDLDLLREFAVGNVASSQVLSCENMFTTAIENLDNVFEKWHMKLRQFEIDLQERDLKIARFEQILKDRDSGYPHLRQQILKLERMNKDLILGNRKFDDDDLQVKHTLQRFKDQHSQKSAGQLLHSEKAYENMNRNMNRNMNSRGQGGDAHGGIMFYSGEGRENRDDDYQCEQTFDFDPGERIPGSRMRNRSITRARRASPEKHERPKWNVTTKKSDRKTGNKPNNNTAVRRCTTQSSEAGNAIMKDTISSRRRSSSARARIEANKERNKGVIPGLRPNLENNTGMLFYPESESKGGNTSSGNVAARRPTNGENQASSINNSQASVIRQGTEGRGAVTSQASLVNKNTSVRSNGSGDGNANNTSSSTTKTTQPGQDSIPTYNSINQYQPTISQKQQVKNKSTTSQKQQLKGESRENGPQVSLRKLYVALLGKRLDAKEIHLRHQAFRKREEMMKTEFDFKSNMLQSGFLLIEGKGLKLFQKSFSALNESYSVRLEALNRALLYAESQCKDLRIDEKTVETELDTALMAAANVAIEKYNVSSWLYQMIEQRESLKKSCLKNLRNIQSSGRGASGDTSNSTMGENQDKLVTDQLQALTIQILLAIDELGTSKVSSIKWGGLPYVEICFLDSESNEKTNIWR